MDEETIRNELLVVSDIAAPECWTQSNLKRETSKLLRQMEKGATHSWSVNHKPHAFY